MMGDYSMPDYSDRELREIAKLQAASRDTDKSMENLRAALAAAPPSPDLRHLTSEEQEIMHRARKAGAVPSAGEKEDLSELIDLEQALRRAGEKE